MRIIRFLSYLVLAVCAADLAFADLTGRIRGTVKDPAGKPIEGVTITIESTGDKPAKYKAVTNTKGEYVHIGIQPNNYRVTPSREGYVPVEFSYVDLRLAPSNKPEEVHFKMQSMEQTPAAQKQTKESPSTAAAQTALSLLDEGKIDEAILSFKKALETEPTNAPILYNLGVAYERKNQAAEARAQFAEAIQNNPDFGEAHFALGNSHMREQNFNAAVTPLTRAAELMPGHYGAAYNLGACLANSGKYAEAEAAFRNAVQANPGEPVAHYQLAMALLGQSKNSEAKVEFMKYLELNPNAADKLEVEELLKSLE